MCSPGKLAVLRSLLVGCCVAISLTAVMPREASGQERERWGVSASVTPSWKLASQIRKVMFEDNEQGNITGSEFSVGLVHGRTRGGDWGVSFTRKPWKDGSGSTSSDEQCATSTQCWTETEKVETSGVYLNAFEAHWAPSFVTIKDRVQIGINLGGGIGLMKGNIVKTTDGFDVTGFNQQTQKATLVPFHTVETLLAAEELVEKFPLIKLEAVGSVILNDALKVKVAGGVNFPAISGRIILVYLFGRN